MIGVLEVVEVAIVVCVVGVGIFQVGVAAIDVEMVVVIIVAFVFVENLPIFLVKVVVDAFDVAIAYCSPCTSFELSF